MKKRVIFSAVVLLNLLFSIVLPRASAQPFDDARARPQDLFVSFPNSGSIYEFTPDGTQFLFASGLNQPTAVAFNRSGDLFVADNGSGNIYKFSPNGHMSTFASGLIAPSALAFNNAGDLFVADYGSGDIYEFAPDGVRHIFAGFSPPAVGMAFDRQDNLFVTGVFGLEVTGYPYFTGLNPGYIYKFGPDGQESIFASVDNVIGPSGLAFDDAGDLAEADGAGQHVYEFTPDGTQFVLNNGFVSGLFDPVGLAFNNAGDVFVSSFYDFNIVEISRDGVQKTFASMLYSPFGLAFKPEPAAAQTKVSVGNPALPFEVYAAPDGAPPLVIMGEYNPAGPLPSSPITFPADGQVEKVNFYGQDYDFTLYALTLVKSDPEANEQTFKVVAARHFSGTADNPGTQSLDLSNFCVEAGDFLAFAGIGPYYPQAPNDTTNTDATYEDAFQAVADNDNDTATPPTLGEKFAVGLNRDSKATYGYIADNFGNQGRIYAINVEFQPNPQLFEHYCNVKPKEQPPQ